MLVRSAVVLVLAGAILSSPAAVGAQGAKASTTSKVPAATQPPAAKAPAEIIPTTAAAKHRKAVFDAYIQAARTSD